MASGSSGPRQAAILWASRPVSVGITGIPKAGGGLTVWIGWRAVVG
jgi:hypothetical protein